MYNAQVNLCTMVNMGEWIMVNIHVEIVHTVCLHRQLSPRVRSCSTLVYHLCRSIFFYYYCTSVPSNGHDVYFIVHVFCLPSKTSPSLQFLPKVLHHLK